jgi:serine/threonine protein kinase/tetratricopeptide (TPR) repeat protein
MNKTESISEREHALFTLAAAKQGPERAAFLDRECAGNPGLRERLELLLAAHENPDSPLDQAATARATLKIDPQDTPEDSAVGRTIGRYKLLEKIGEGGCGVVYVAEQIEPVRRRVALKVIKLGMDSKAVVARFEAERQALAMMDHPNIAKVLDAGTTETGRPFFVMELVRGIRITDYCDQNQLSTKERMELFIHVCHAIQHAHQKGIIHRDIKPSNILVGLHDGVPVPKVIDFGIAKATEGRLTDATVYTQLHQFIGTPAYMSPEQAEMSNLDIDTRSDIYSLGVLLYELLTGQTPFDANELIKEGLDAIRKTIREVEPQRPSTKLSTLQGEALTATAKRHGTQSLQLLKMIRGDLDWVVMKCLEKDRTRRYETANGLAMDLKRHLENEPVLARSPSAAYRLVKSVRRNRVAFAVSAIIALVLVIGTAVSTWQALRARNAERAAEHRRFESERARADAEAVAGFLVDVFRSPDPVLKGRAVTVAETLQRGVKWVESSSLTNQPELKEHVQAALGLTYFGLGLRREGMPLLENSRDYLLSALANSQDQPGYNLMLDALNALERGYHESGRKEQAIKLREEFLAASRKLNGLTNANTVDAMVLLSRTYGRVGQHREAIKLGEEGLELSRKVNGPEHTNTVWAMLSLADLYPGVAGRQGDGLKLREEALRLGLKTQGPSGPMTLWAKMSLAVSYHEVGRSEDALRLREDALRLTKEVNGLEHPETIVAMSCLAESLAVVGRQREALELRQEVLRLRQKVNGEEDPDTVLAMYSLANACTDAGRLSEALKLSEETLKLSRKVNGEEDEATVVAMLGLAGSYGGLPARREDALKLRKEVLRLRKKEFGDENPNTFWSMFALASSYRDLGNRAQALQLSQEMLGLAQRVNGPDHFHTAVATRTLAQSYGDNGRLVDALRLFDEALALERKRDPNADVPNLLTDFAVCCAMTNQLGRASNLLEEAASSKQLKPFEACHVALLQAWFGMNKQYLATRLRMLKQPIDTNDVNQTSYTALLASVVPTQSAALQEVAVSVAQRSVQLMGTDPWVFTHELTLGMAEFRSGQYATSEQAFLAAETGAKQNPEGPCPAAVQSAAAFYRAMSLFRQNKAADAAKLFAEAAAAMKPLPTDEKNPLVDGASYQDVVAWLAFKEAKALLTVATAAKL